MLKKIIVTVTVLFFTNAAYSTGFSIYEQGAKASGMAGAFIAQANDVSAVFYNPAGITKLNGLTIGAGTTIIMTDFAFTGPEIVDKNLYTAAQPGTFPPSTFYAAYQINDWASAGFGFYSMFGLASEWGSDKEPWAGSFLTTKSELQTFSLNPVVAFKVMDNLSLAVGFNFTSASVNMEQNIFFAPRTLSGKSALEASTTGYGFNAGLQYEPFEGLSVGIVYRSNIMLEFTDGDASFSFPVTGDTTIDGEVKALFPASVKGDADLKLPDFIGIGLAYRFTPNLIAEVDYTQFGWSSYDELTIRFDQPVGGQMESTTEKGYQDAYSIRLGLEYRFIPSMTVRAGYAWDKYAVQDEFVEPSLPEGNRHNYTLGVGYKNNGLTVDAMYHILLQDNRTITNSKDNFNGTYSGLANLVGLSLGYSF